MREGRKRMFHLKSWKALGLSATLISLMLVAALAGTAIRPVQAQEMITLHAILGTDPEDGEYSGYHSVMYAIKDALKQIGINLELHFYDSLTIYDYQWYTYWDRPGAPPGWDIGVGEWWCDMGSLIWEPGMILKENTPPTGYNIMPYLNPKADKIFKKAEATIDAETRQKLMWKWQELAMHDLPMIPMFYLEIYDASGKWVKGFDPCADPLWRGHPWSQLEVDVTMAEAAGVPVTDGKATLAWGEYEDMSCTNPMFIVAYAEDSIHSWTFDTLYASYRTKPDGTPGMPPELNRSFFDPKDPLYLEYKYTPLPNLAIDYPVYSPDYRTAYIPLRDNVYWVWPPNHPDHGWDIENPDPEIGRGPNFNASDVVFTFGALLDPETLCEGWGDFQYVIDHVEILTSENDELGLLDKPGENKFGETYTWQSSHAVKFILKEPHADLVPLLYNTWGGYILPSFVFKGVRHGEMRSHSTNYNPDLLPGTGPWVFNHWEKGDHVELKPNPWYWKETEGGGFKPFETIDTVICRIIPETEAMKKALLAHEIAWGLWGLPLDKWKMKEDEYLNYYSYKNPCAHPIYLNLNPQPDGTPNPLANRYLRLAIVHAIPYEEIFPLVEPWGKKAEPMKTLITPQHFYTDPTDPTGKTVSLYIPDEVLLPYSYDLDKAKYYMNLYHNQTNGDYTKSPLGDADQSGLVDLTDWDIWVRNIGTATTPINIYPDWPYVVDPNFDNDGGNLVDSTDVLLWSKNYGTKYEPFVYGTTT